MIRNSMNDRRIRTVFAGFLLLACVLSAGSCLSADTPTGQASISAPIVIAHRGASGSRPEHTLGAYELALQEGADFIELDLVATRDAALIARHENALAVVRVDSAGRVLRDEALRPLIVEATTDVADHPEFAGRLVTKRIDGRPVTGWFSEDFTLDEIRTLKARERMPGIRPQNRSFDDKFAVPQLEDAIALLQSFERESGRRAGLYLEIKHPTYFHHEGRRLDGSEIGIDLGARLLKILGEAGFVDPHRVFIQAFEVAPLIELKDRMAADGLDLPLIQLFGDVSNLHYRATPADMAYHSARGSTAIYGELADLVEGGIRPELSYAELDSPAVLEYMARRYAAGIGPARQNVFRTRPAADGEGLVFTGGFTKLLDHALAAGLLVHPYTLRAETMFLLHYRSTLLAVSEEADLLLGAGVQGLFIDQPAEGRMAVDRFRATRIEGNGSLR